MKLKLFYSWQSDLPNNTNRGYINNCIEKASKKIYEVNNSISEYSIDSDSRDESGTPDLVSSIFSKIDECDIFIADISIINTTSNQRKTPNPNVLIELGYASKALGWDNILCLFNSEYGKIEELPFDIRFRKPIQYNTSQDKSAAKKRLISDLYTGIQSIVDNRLTNKRFYNSLKREVDLALQAILFDFLKLLYFSTDDNGKLYNYSHLLHMISADIQNKLNNQVFLGFQLFKNHDANINDFKAFFNDNSNIHFFNENEKNILARIIVLLSDMKRTFHSNELFENKGPIKGYKVISGYKMNPQNSRDGYILLEEVNSQEGIVKDSGKFAINDTTLLTTQFTIKSQYLLPVSKSIRDLSNAINGWIRVSGNVFIFNHREL